MLRKLFISLLFIMLLQAEAWADVLIIVRQQAEAPGNYIRICDVARVEGPKELAAAVAKTVLAPAPPRGESREITRWDIEHRLYEMGLESKVLFTGNETVKVTGNGSAALWRMDNDYDSGAAPTERRDGRNAGGMDAARSLVPAGSAAAASPAAAPALASAAPETATTEKIAAATPTPRQGNFVSSLREETREQMVRTVSDYLAGRYSRPDVEVETRLVSLSDAIPPDAVSLTVAEALEGRLPGRASLALKAADADGRELKTVTVGVDADVYALAPVAAKPLYKGDVLTPRDVIVTRIKMKPGSSYLPPDTRAIEGREMQRPLQQGSPILAGDATPTAAVKRGSLVAVDAAGTGWRLQASAKALGTGNIDDVIMVEDVTTKAKYQARVTGFGTVATVVRKNPQGIVLSDQTR